MRRLTTLFLSQDQYKIRKAFVSEEDRSLIVADYGQLELRLLAHITKCESMIKVREIIVMINRICFVS
jgi:DNA polymerase I